MDDLRLPTVFEIPEIVRSADCTIEDLLEGLEIPPSIWPRIIVSVNGVPVMNWNNVNLYVDDIVHLAVVPAGGESGKQILSSVAIIAISLAAPFAAAALVGASTGAAFFAATAAITLGGTLLVSALIPPPNLGSAGTALPGGDYSPSPTENPAFRFTGQSNSANPYGRVPRIYGRVRFYPNLASTPLIENVGKTSRITALYDFGIGDINVYDIKIGNSDVELLDPNIVIHKNSFCDNLKLVQKSVSYQEFAYILDRNIPLQLQTENGANKATLEIYFPEGLVRISSDGQRSNHSVGFKIQYKESGTSNWITVPGTSFKGAKIGEVAWIYSPEYVAPDITGETYWRDSVNLKKGVYRYRSELFRNGNKIFSWQSTDQPRVSDTATVNDLPYRKGALQLARSPEPGDNDTNAEYYELLVPRQDSNADVTVTESTNVAFTLSVNMIFPKEAVWDIKIIRTTQASDITDAVSSLRDVAAVTLLKSFFPGKVLNLAKKHTMMEFEYTADEKVSGVVDSINALAQSNLRACNGSGFTTVVASSNPAYIVLDILAGEANRYPLKQSQIDFPQFAKLASICNELVTQTVAGVTYTSRRFEWNGVIESDISVYEACQAILATCHAQLTIAGNGKVSVIIDEEQTTPRQLITPENSWGFSGNRKFPVLPDAFRVSFWDEDSDWQPTDIVVYRDGFNSSNAKIIEELPTWGITSFPEAYRYGRYMMAQGMSRTETFTFSMDVENLVVQRGDLVAIQHDVPKLGGGAFRVIAVDSANDRITVNRPAEIASGSYAVRLNTGVIKKGSIVWQANQDVFQLDDVTGISVDNLIALGESNPVTRDYIVTSINPGEDLTAQLTVVRYVPEVYTADQGPLPDWDPGFGIGLRTTTQVVAEIIDVTYAWIYEDRIPYMRVIIRWSITKGRSSYAGSSIFVKIGKETILLEENVQEGIFQYAHKIIFSDLQFFSNSINYRVSPFNHVGVSGTPSIKSVLLPGYVSVPEPPRNVHLDMNADAVTVLWTPSVTNDVMHYLIRYTPEINNPEWDGSSDVAKVSWDQTKSTQPPRLGTYMICAINVVGTRSAAVEVRTTVDTLPDNYVQQIAQEDPAWSGNKDKWTAGYTSPNNFTIVRKLDGSLVNAEAPFLTSFLLEKLDGTFVNIGNAPSIPSNYLVTQVPVQFLKNDIVDPLGVWADNIPIPSNGSTVEYFMSDPIIATYEFDQAHDFGAIVEARILSYLTVGAVDPTNPGQPLGKSKTSSPYSYVPNYVTDKSSLWAIRHQYSVSDDGTTWKEWRDFFATDITARYVRFRIIGEVYATSLVIVVKSARVEMQLARRTDIVDLVVPLSGVVVDFDPDFYLEPSIAVTWPNQPDVISYEMTGVTRAGGTLKLLNKSLSPIAGRAVLTISGYGKLRGTSI